VNRDDNSTYVRYAVLQHNYNEYEDVMVTTTTIIIIIIITPWGSRIFLQRLVVA
jgi:hypothetical protein